MKQSFYIVSISFSLLILLGLSSCLSNNSKNNDDQSYYSQSEKNQKLLEFVSHSLKNPSSLRAVALESDTLIQFSASNSDISQNNIQEKGVSEGDRQLNDGQDLYALSVPDYQDKNSTSQLMIWPLDDENNLQTLSIPEYHSELFKNQNTLVSLSTGVRWSFWSNYLYLRDTTVGIQWYDIDEINQLVSKNQYWQIEGSLLRSLKVKNQLFSVIKFIPKIDNLPYDFPKNEEEITENYNYLLANLQLNQLVPKWTIDGVEQDKLISAENCQLLHQQAPQYYELNIIYIVAMDMENINKKPQVTCIVGNVETLYGSSNALYLSSTDYKADYQTNSVSNSITWIPSEYFTKIHRLEITAVGTTYSASGMVSGLIPGDARQKSFRFSERDKNHLAVISYVGDSKEDNKSRVKLTVLQYSSETKSLNTLSTLPDAEKPESLGKDGELLYATRFIDDFAYLVTFAKTDPLYAISLSDLNNPKKISELEITGFSDYLHPLTDPSYILGIGHEATPATTFQQESLDFSWFLGVKLSLFKQKNTSLTETTKEVIGFRGSNTPVLSNHHAFTYLASTQNRAFRFAFVISINDTPSEKQSNNKTPPYYHWTKSEVRVYQVRNGKLELIDSILLAKRDSNSSAHQWSPDLSNTRTIISSQTTWVLHQNRLIKKDL